MQDVVREAMRNLAWDLEAVYEGGVRHVLSFPDGGVYGRGCGTAVSSCAVWPAPAQGMWIGALRFRERSGVSIAVFSDIAEFCAAVRDVVCLKIPQVYCETPVCSVGLSSEVPLSNVDAVGAMCDAL
jgi:hypothetical protein